jgi:hypothetical protein
MPLTSYVFSIPQNDFLQWVQIILKRIVNLLSYLYRFQTLARLVYLFALLF